MTGRAADGHQRLGATRSHRRDRAGARLDQGVPGVVGVETAAQAAGPLRRAQRSRSVTVLTAREVVIDTDQPQVPVEIDGESVPMPTPRALHARPLPLQVQVRGPVAGPDRHGQDR
jgi:diacylglycerol kinase family enzyme